MKKFAVAAVVGILLAGLGATWLQKNERDSRGVGPRVDATLARSEPVTPAVPTPGAPSASRRPESPPATEVAPTTAATASLFVRATWESNGLPAAGLVLQLEPPRGSGRAPDPIETLAEIFVSRGYEAHCIFGRELVPLSEFDAAKHQVYGRRPYGNNFLFTHPARAV